MLLEYNQPDLLEESRKLGDIESSGESFSLEIVDPLSQIKMTKRLRKRFHLNNNLAQTNCSKKVSLLPQR